MRGGVKEGLLPVYCLYDEFGNSYIPEVQELANTLRGYGVSLSIVLQSISQVYHKYGQEQGKSLLGAFSHKIVLPGADNETTLYFESISGKVRDEYKTLGSGRSEYREYNLINSAEIRMLKDNQALLISKNRQPVKLKTSLAYQNIFLKSKLQVPSVNIVSNLDRDLSVSYVNLR